MNIIANPAEAIRQALVATDRGVVGVVDTLLLASGTHGLELDWHADHLRIRTREGSWEELAGVRLRKSVFRAILARLTALCNERRSDSVSPYGGQGELVSDANPAVVFRISFTNTPQEQRLVLTPVLLSSPTNGEASNGMA